jgi:hypothetical protein
LAAVLTPVLVISALLILLFAWKNYHLKKEMAILRQTELPKTDRSEPGSAQKFANNN